VSTTPGLPRRSGCLGSRRLLPQTNAGVRGASVRTPLARPSERPVCLIWDVSFQANAAGGYERDCPLLAVTARCRHGDRPKQMTLGHAPCVEDVTHAIGVELSSQPTRVGVERAGAANYPNAPQADERRLRGRIAPSIYAAFTAIYPACTGLSEAPAANRRRAPRPNREAGHRGHDSKEAQDEGSNHHPAINSGGVATSPNRLHACPDCQKAGERSSQEKGHRDRDRIGMRVRAQSRPGRVCAHADRRSAGPRRAGDVHGPDRGSVGSGALPCAGARRLLGGLRWRRRLLPQRTVALPAGPEPRRRNNRSLRTRASLRAGPAAPGSSGGSPSGSLFTLNILGLAFMP